MAMKKSLSQAAIPMRKRQTQEQTALAPIARIISIGDELTLGRTVDTNATHISRWLTDRGFVVDLMQVVGDAESAIVSALNHAARGADGADLIICSGGLGPTDDDRTRSALARAMGVSLIHHEPSWRRIGAWFSRSRSGAPVPAINRRQALLPKSARPLINHRGTAPGMLARLEKSYVACLPGVPHEMVAMLEDFSKKIPKLIPGLSPPTISELWISGIGESTAQELIGNLLTESNPQVGITVNEKGHITLRIVGTKQIVAQRHQQLALALGQYVLPAAGLAESLVAELSRQKLVMTTAESCTCGHIVAAIGAVAGASKVLHEGLVAYHEEVKHRLLGVPRETLRDLGVVSEATVIAMAEGARRHSGADLAVATTGIAGPGGGTRSNPVGTVWIAVSGKKGTRTKKVDISGTRERVQRRSAAHALQLAWEYLRDEVRR